MKKFFTLTLALLASFSLWAADDCTTLVSFATSQHQTSNPRKVYGYTTTEMTESSKVELTCDNSDTKGQNDGAEIRLNYGKYLQIPEQTSVTSVTIDYKFYNSSSTQRTCSLKVEIGSTVKQVEISGKNSDGYKTAEFTFSPAATGTIKITHMGSGSSNLNLYLDNITYCTTVAETHALAWDFAEGSCSATAGTDYTAAGQVAEGATITYPANNTMTKDGYDFKGWSTNVTTMPTSDLTITAQWATHQTSSDATLSALSVAGCTLSPAFAPATTAYTIALPFYASMPVVGAVTATKNDSYAKTPVVSISGNVITVACEAEDGTKKNYTITVNIAPVPTASSSINIEQLVLDNSKSYNIGDALDAANIAYVDKDALDSLLMGTESKPKDDCNEAYLGLKFKKATSKFTIIVPSGEALNVKFGATNNLTVSVNGAAPAAPSLTNGVYSLAASDGAKEVVFALTGTQTVVLKQIMVGEDIAVVRPFLATVADTEHGTASVELPKYAKGEQVTVNYAAAEGYELDEIAVSGYDSKGKTTVVEVTEDKFTMPGSPVTITVTFKVASATALDNTEDGVKAVKFFENGQLFIRRGDKIFDTKGQVLK